MNAFAAILLTWIVAQTFYFGGYGPDLGFIKQLEPHHALFFLVVVSFGLAVAKGQTVSRRLEWPERLLLLSAVIWGVSFVLSGAHYDRTVYKNKWLSALLNVTLYPYVTYFCVRAMPYRKEFVVKFLKVICFLGIYLACSGIFEHYEMTSLVWPDYIMDPNLGTHFGRARGPFMESVAMARVLTIVFASWLVMRLEGGPMIRTLAMLIIPITMASVYFTETRGPWIGWALTCLAFILFKSPVRRTVCWLMVLVCLAGTIGLSKFSFAGRNLFLDRQSTFTDRIVTWVVSSRMMMAHPIAGIGYGRFNAEWENYYTDVKGIEFTGFDGSHNTFLTVAAETGLPSLMLYLLMAFLMWRRCFQVYQRLDRRAVFERSFVVMVMGIWWMYLFTSWFSDLRWNTTQNTLMFTMLALVAAMKRDLCQTAIAAQKSPVRPEPCSLAGSLGQSAPAYTL